MIVAAVAAEYNPFHAGHAYQIAETRAAGATHIVAIMSGNFTQRGTPAVVEKRVRAEMALAGGVDLVLELPLPFAMATAQRFAAGVAQIAAGMGCVDLLSFGSETGYLSILKAAAKAVDSDAVLARMSEHLATGITFARARQLAVSELCGDEVAEVLAAPNDSLAVEYIRALEEVGGAIIPFAVRRAGAAHDSDTVTDATASASYLRALIRENRMEEAKTLTPAPCFDILERAFREGEGPYDEHKLELVMLGILRRLTLEELSRLPDMSEGLEHRIYAAIRRAVTLDEVYALAKSKRYPAARIRRAVTAAFLGLYRPFADRPAPYIRVLGFNARGREVLARMKDTATLPVSDSLANLRRLGGDAALFAEEEARTTDLYRMGLPNLCPCGSDYIKPGVRML
jgi:predicted nucleotidyltransferase